MKKILMAAVAVSAIAAGTAGAATITEAKLNSNFVYDGTTTPSTPVVSPYKLANEVIYGTAGLDTAGSGNYVLAKVASGRLGVGSYTVTFDYAGPAGFALGLSNTSVSAVYGAGETAGLCLVTPILQTGGLAGAKTATYGINISGTCDSAAAATTNAAPQNFMLTTPLTVTGPGDVTVKATFGQGGSSIDNGASAARTLITNAAGFKATATASDTATQFKLGTTPVYTTLQATDAIDDVIGKVTVVGVAGVYLDASRTLQATTPVLKADLVLTGDFTYLLRALPLLVLHLPVRLLSRVSPLRGSLLVQTRRFTSG
jgi:hypothetical protein